MARPSIPLISRAATVEAALRILDEGGVEALSLPRLARELNVKAPSLYHHFQDKDEILAEVAKAVVSATQLPPGPRDGDWQDWFTQLCLNFRAAVLKHRRAAPILFRFMPRDHMIDLYEQAATTLASCGVPDHHWALILDGLEKFALGAILAEAVQPHVRSQVRFENADPDRHPILTRASRRSERGAREIFEIGIRSYLRGIAAFTADDD